MPRMRGVHPIGVHFERRPCRAKRLRWPAQVARHERDLGLGDDTPRASHVLSRTEGARCTLQESLRAYELAELRHRDTAKRKRRRVVAQANPLQYAEEVTRGERPRRSRDQRVHGNPVTLVTPTFRRPTLSVLMTYDQRQREANGKPKEGAKAMRTQISGTAGISQASTENHRVVSRDEWVAERKTLLARERELTRLRDQLARERRALPWVRIDKSYAFDAPEG